MLRIVSEPRASAIVEQDGSDSPAERSWTNETSQALAPLVLQQRYGNLVERNDSRGLRSFGTISAHIAWPKHRDDPRGVFQFAIGLPMAKSGRL
jgi:hypothetical protein